MQVIMNVTIRLVIERTAEPICVVPRPDRRKNCDSRGTFAEYLAQLLGPKVRINPNAGELNCWANRELRNFA